jgi:hypothetical protein
MTKQYAEKEEIDKIILILKKYEEKDFFFTEHYHFSIAQRDIGHEFLLETFRQFERIRLIEEDILKKGDKGYDLYYELSNNRTLIIGVCPKERLIFIHGILRYRRWQNAVKKQYKNRR